MTPVFVYFLRCAYRWRVHNTPRVFQASTRPRPEKREAPCRGVHKWDGPSLARPTSMVTFFMADPAQVRPELSATTGSGPYELTVHHAGGAVVEYFTTQHAAVLRRHQLEDVPEASRAKPVTRGSTR